jgi:ADP-ribose pyrophosphatase YjhB (NUDIX family)
MPAPILQVAAKAVIVDGAGRLLLVRESRKATNTQEGRYGLVGGRLQPGEGFFDAFTREVKEETGLTEVTLSDEHDHFIWIDPADYPDYPMMKPDDLAIDQLIKELRPQ